LHNLITTSLSNATVTIIDDRDVNDGKLFVNNTENAFDTLIILHEEYVTQKMYDDFKRFVAAGGSIVFLDGNIFYAEVNYDRNNNTITLVKGHDWKFDGKIARPSVHERWFNETKEWVGGNFWITSIHDKIIFTNNVFNYDHFEETYVNNPNDTIILDYGASYQNTNAQKKIATYELNYGKGNVIVVGLYGQYAMSNKNFQELFGSLLLNTINPHLNQTAVLQNQTAVLQNQTAVLQNQTLLEQQNQIKHYQPYLKTRIAIVDPTFTEAAYNNAFYVFYAKHALVLPTTTVTTDLNLLTSSLDMPSTHLIKFNRGSINLLHNLITTSLSNATVTIIDDRDVNDGKLFVNNTENAFDTLIILHEEYVTQKMYDDFKRFVAAGGSIVFLDGNIFYAEVNYDRNNNTITLVKGHDWKFDGKIARPSVHERWFNETKEWVGGNFWITSIHDKIIFTNNVFNYDHFEETYVNNPNDTIILDYGASYQNTNAQKKIATYELNYGKGNVIVVGLYGQYAMSNKNFQELFGSLLLNTINPHLNQTAVLQNQTLLEQQNQTRDYLKNETAAD